MSSFVLFLLFLPSSFDSLVRVARRLFCSAFGCPSPSSTSPLLHHPPRQTTRATTTSTTDEQQSHVADQVADSCTRHARSPSRDHCEQATHRRIHVISQRSPFAWRGPSGQHATAVRGMLLTSTRTCKLVGATLRQQAIVDSAARCGVQRRRCDGTSPECNYKSVPWTTAAQAGSIALIHSCERRSQAIIGCSCICSRSTIVALCVYARGLARHRDGLNRFKPCHARCGRQPDPPIAVPHSPHATIAMSLFVLSNHMLVIYCVVYLIGDFLRAFFYRSDTSSDAVGISVLFFFLSIWLVLNSLIYYKAFLQEMESYHTGGAVAAVEGTGVSSANAEFANGERSEGPITTAQSKNETFGQAYKRWTYYLKTEVGIAYFLNIGECAHRCARW
jgi:hypothetical protein